MGAEALEEAEYTVGCLMEGLHSAVGEERALYAGLIGMVLDLVGGFGARDAGEVLEDQQTLRQVFIGGEGHYWARLALTV